MTSDSFCLGAYCRWALLTLLIVTLPIVDDRPVWGQARLDSPPILYRETIGRNPVTDLFARVDSGETRLAYTRAHENLLSILRELEIPVSSQVLVFSKTSLQVGRISPSNPRAFFFNDDVVVGWIRGSSLLEIATSDPKLGSAFYTVRMRPERPSLRRSDNTCLGCHEATTREGKVPVQMVQSVMTRDSGKVNLLLDVYTTDHASPFSERWGGWYVTGSSGSMRHMGNMFLEDEKLLPIEGYERDGLAGQIDLQRWPSKHSDIVALMVLEHQTEMHNRFTRANFDVRRAKYAVEHAGDENTESVNFEEAVERSAKLVVDYMLFENETKLTSPIVGASSFQSEFAARGPTTETGRSLREFDLRKRLFAYPCSYLIYSAAFDSLEKPLKAAIYRRLFDVLSGGDQSDEYAHLSVKDRRAIMSILKETKDDLPAYWLTEAALSSLGP